LSTGSKLSKSLGRISRVDAARTHAVAKEFKAKRKCKGANEMINDALFLQQAVPVVTIE